MPTADEGVVGGQLVQIHRDSVEATLRERALKKLTELPQNDEYRLSKSTGL